MVKSLPIGCGQRRAGRTPFPTRPKSSSFAENAEGVNTPQSIYRICNLCSEFSTKCGGFLHQMCSKKPPPSAIAEFFLSSANAEVFWAKKIIISSGIRTQIRRFARHRFTHYSTVLSMALEGCNNIYKPKRNFFSSYKKNYKISCVGNTIVRNWLNFGYPVISSFDKNSQKRLRQNVQNAELISSAFPPHFRHFEKYKKLRGI